MNYLNDPLKKISSVVMFFFLLSSLCSQSNGLVVEYDLFEDQVKYIRDGIELEKPNLQRGENIYVVVKEFNPYITRAHLEVLNNTYDQYSKSERGGDSDGSGMGFNLTGLLGGLSTGTDIAESLNLFPRSRGASSAEVAQLQSQFSSQLAKLKVAEDKVNNYAEKLRLFQKAELSRELALYDIEKLKQNSRIRPSRIREMIEEEVRFAFAKLPGEDIDIDDLIDDAEKKEEVRLTVRQYEDAIDEYQSMTTSWLNLSRQLEILEAPSDDRLNFIKVATDSIITVIDNNVEQAEAADLDDIIELSLEPNLELLADLRQVHEELKSVEFEYSFSPLQAFDDNMHIKLDFERKDEDGDYEDFKSLTQIIPVTGGWKLSGSVGISFGQLFGDRFDYVVEDDVIIGNSADAFVPYITSFAHFYRQSPAPVNFGASFGMGVPLQNSGDVTSVSFFLGPSAYIGQSQRLIVTAGFLGAKSQKLSNGFAIGDEFDGVTETLPITNKYKIGAFLSMSFSIF